MRTIYKIRRKIKRKMTSYMKSMGLYKKVSSNIYHCSVQKSASSWFATLFMDPAIFRLSNRPLYRPGMDYILTEKEKLSEYKAPEGSVVGPLYIGYDDFKSIQKTKDYKGFYVMRDPRDFLISQYFSNRFTHKPGKKIVETHKAQLDSLSEEEGIMYNINFFPEVYESMRSWTKCDDPRMKVMKYEDLFGKNQFDHIKALFEHLEIRISDQKLKSILDQYSFKSISGRKKGEGDKHSHYRKGVAGDWKNYFSEAHKKHFKEIAGQILIDLGYEQDLNW